MHSHLPGCDSASLDERFLTFRKVTLFYSSTVKLCRVGLLDSEDEGTTILRNLRNRSPKDRASHSSRLESSNAKLIAVSTNSPAIVSFPLTGRQGTSAI